MDSAPPALNTANLKDNLPPTINSIGSTPPAEPTPNPPFSPSPYSPVSPPPPTFTPPATPNQTSRLKKFAPFIALGLFIIIGAAAAANFLLPKTSSVPTQLPALPVGIGTATTEFEINGTWNEGNKDPAIRFEYADFPTVNGHKVLRFRTRAGIYHLCPLSLLQQEAPPEWQQYTGLIYQETKFGWAQYGPTLFRPHDHFPDTDTAFTAYLDRDGSRADFSLSNSSCPFEIDLDDLFNRFNNGTKEGTLMVKTFVNNPSDTNYADNLTVHIVNTTPSLTPTNSPTPTSSLTPTNSPTPTLIPIFTPDSFQCTSLTSPSTSPQKGSTITLTCLSQASSLSLINKAEFRISNNGGSSWQELGSVTPTLTSSPNKTYSAQKTYQIPDYGNYWTQCRICSNLNCTNWGDTQSWPPSEVVEPTVAPAITPGEPQEPPLAPEQPPVVLGTDSGGD